MPEANTVRPKPKGKGAKKFMIERGGSTRGLVPAVPDARYDIAYNEYLAELDPRGDGDSSKAIRIALASTADSRFRRFLELVGDPAWAMLNQSPVALAKRCEISLVEFQDWRQKASTQRILAKAQEGMLEVTGDIVKHARSRDVACDRCDGFGSVVCDSKAPKNTPGLRRIKGMKAADDTWTRDCPSCKGKGTLSVYGSEHAIDKLIDMTGLSSKGKGGAAVQIVQNFGGASMESAVDRMSKISFDVSDVIDVSPEPSESAPDAV